MLFRAHVSVFVTPLCPSYFIVSAWWWWWCTHKQSVYCLWKESSTCDQFTSTRSWRLCNLC